MVCRLGSMDSFLGHISTSPSRTGLQSPALFSTPSSIDQATVHSPPDQIAFYLGLTDDVSGVIPPDGIEVIWDERADQPPRCASAASASPRPMPSTRILANWCSPQPAACCGSRLDLRSRAPRTRYHAHPADWRYARAGVALDTGAARRAIDAIRMTTTATRSSADPVTSHRG